MARLNITQVRSRIGSTKLQKKNLDALGLRKMNRTVTHDDSPIIRGMIEKVHHLVIVTESKEEAKAKAKPAAAAAPAEAKAETAAEANKEVKPAEKAPAAKKPAAAKSADKPAAKKPAAKKPAAKKDVKPATSKKDE